MKQTTISPSIPLITALFISLFGLQIANAQNTISKSLLEEDLVLLKRNLEEVHGGLYAYTSKQEMDTWFKDVNKNLKDTMKPFEFYKLLAPLNSVIKNGHTNIGYPNFGDDFHFLPIQLYKYKNSFYLKKSLLKEHRDLEGTQILEIDGIPIDEIYKRLLKNYRRDGDNLTMPIEDLSSLFGLEYTIVYGKKSSYPVTLLKEGSKVEVAISSALLDKDIRKQFNSGNKLKPLSFKVNDNIGILTYPTFDEATLKEANYKALLNASFAEIKAKNLEHLIIDVRNNGGGDPVPTQELISYLIDKEFIMYEDVYTITNEIKDRKFYKKQGLFWLNLFSWLKVKKIKEHHYRLRNDEGMDVYKAKENNFKGQLYVLTNGNSFSATGEFTSFIKHHRDNTFFVGEEVGGNEYQNTSGVSYTITLPNSKQRVIIPLVVWEMNIAAKNSGHGVQPDFWVRNTMKEEMEHTDSVMEYALELAKKSSAEKE